MAARRGHGDGSILEDKERGGYVVLVRYDGGRAKARARTKAEARRRLTQLKAEIDATVSAGAGKLAVAQLCNQSAQESWPAATTPPPPSRRTVGR